MYSRYNAFYRNKHIYIDKYHYTEQLKAHTDTETQIHLMWIHSMFIDYMFCVYIETWLDVSISWWVHEHVFIFVPWYAELLFRRFFARVRCAAVLAAFPRPFGRYFYLKRMRACLNMTMSPGTINSLDELPPAPGGGYENQNWWASLKCPAGLLQWINEMLLKNDSLTIPVYS